MAEGQLKWYVPDATEASVRAAANAAIAAGGGRVMLPDATITITSALPVASGLHYQGVPPRLAFTGGIPDSDWSFTGGTVLQGDGTFPAFSYNITPKGSPGTPFWGDALSNFGLFDIGFSNFSYGIQAGATNSMSFMYSRFENLFMTGITSWGIDACNYMHTEWHRIWIRQAANIMRFRGDVATATLNCGNCVYDSIFGIQPNYGGRGLVFEAAAGAVFGSHEVRRPQINCFSRAEVTQTVTFTNGSPNLAVTDGTKFPVGMPFKFTTTVAGFTANIIYVVLTQSGNTITVATKKSGAAISANASTTGTVKSYGMPALEIVGLSTGGIVASSFTNLDMEGNSSALIYMENNQQVRLEATGVGAVGSYATFVARACAANYVYNSDTSAVTDFDVNSNNIQYYGGRGNNLQYTGYGQWYDGPNNKYVTSINGFQTGNQGSLETHFGAGGGFIYPAAQSIGQRVTALNSGGTIDAGRAGVLVFSGSAPITYTLPTINDTNAGSTLNGCKWEIVNAGSANLTVATDGTQVFNGVAAKTSVVLTPGNTIDITGFKNASGGFGLKAVMGAALP